MARNEPGREETLCVMDLPQQSPGMYYVYIFSQLTGETHSAVLVLICIWVSGYVCHTFWVVQSCLTRPSFNCLIHFYKRVCVSVVVVEHSNPKIINLIHFNPFSWSPIIFQSISIHLFPSPFLVDPFQSILLVSNFFRSIICWSTFFLGSVGRSTYTTILYYCTTIIGAEQVLLLLLLC